MREKTVDNGSQAKQRTHPKNRVTEEEKSILVRINFKVFNKVKVRVKMKP